MVTADFEHLSDDVSTQRNKKGTAQDDDDGASWQENRLNFMQIQKIIHIGV